MSSVVLNVQGKNLTLMKGEKLDLTHEITIGGEVAGGVSTTVTVNAIHPSAPPPVLHRALLYRRDGSFEVQMVRAQFTSHELVMPIDPLRGSPDRDNDSAAIRTRRFRYLRAMRDGTMLYEEV